MKKLVIIIVALALGTMPLLALAFDPGAGGGPEPRVPQGPNAVACANRGQQGIANAAAHGGRVHCEHGIPPE